MAIRFDTNIPVTVRFPYGDHKEVNGQYGQQFMYTIEVDGLRDRLYATPGLHHKLQEAGMGAGVVLTVTKIEVEGNRKDWRVETHQGLNGKAVMLGVEQVNGKTSHPNGHHPEITDSDSGGEQPALECPDFERLHQTMECCLRASSGAWEKLEVEVPYTSEDVRAVGITMFLECSRKGIVPQVVEEVLPF